MEMNELWVYLGELINQGIEWIGLNWKAIGGSALAALGTGGILSGAVAIVKTVVPILKNTNVPVLKSLGTLADSLMPKVDLLMTTINKMETKVNLLESENRTLKEYIALAAETNAKSVFLDAETKERYAQFAVALKAIPNEIVQNASKEIESAIADNEISVMEAVKIASVIPSIEKALGTPISDIVSKGV